MLDPLTVLGSPSLAGAGLFPLQVIDPAMVLPSISVALSSTEPPAGAVFPVTATDR